MIPPELLQLMCCPETHQDLRPARSSVVDALNREIAAGGLRTRGGQLVKEPIEGGLVRADGKFLYPIRRQVPVMLIDEALPLGALPGDTG